MAALANGKRWFLACILVLGVACSTVVVQSGHTAGVTNHHSLAGDTYPPPPHLATGL